VWKSYWVYWGFETEFVFVRVIVYENLEPRKTEHVCGVGKTLLMERSSSQGSIHCQKLDCSIHVWSRRIATNKSL